MTQATVPHLEQMSLREVIAFPRVDEFYNLLQDRVHMIASSYLLRERFTTFINALPRRRTLFINRYENVQLVYAGIPRQRELLEGGAEHRPRELDPYWNFLDVTDLNSDTAVVSSQLFQAFNSGSYGLADIPKVGMGRLEDYFESILYPERTNRQPTPRQEAEYQILRNQFNVLEDYYLSVPLIQFGEFDGIVHLVYSSRDHKRMTERAISNLIRSFSAVIEYLILEWDLVGRNPEKSRAIMVPLDPAFYRNVNRNPILKELSFDQYYQKHLPFFKERIRFNEDIIHSKVYQPYLRAAIMSIMVDSYAHNISAHSLVALNWWFKQRADLLREQSERHHQEVAEVEEMIDAYLPEGFDRDRLRELLAPWRDQATLKPVGDGPAVVTYPGPLAGEVQSLLKFLMQKGAFWSGIARDNHFGGESTNLYDLLWHDFINNPLYLGTIAKSEGIRQLRLRLIFYEPKAAQPARPERPCWWPKQVTRQGILAEINLYDPRPAAAHDPERGAYLTGEDGHPLYWEDHPELALLSRFVSPGKDYVDLKNYLRRHEVFLPGEVVGRHAFYTLIENEIRNIKHYKGDALRQIREEGLEICLAVQESAVRPELDGADYALLRIGLWINHPTELRLPGNKTLLESRYHGLRQGIMDEETFAPRLGGGFQDKICAGMLFNNRFGKVQQGDNNPHRGLESDDERDHLYYPWLVPTTSDEAQPHHDTELCMQLTTEDLPRWRKTYDHERGYFKKYFHLWKAAPVRTLRGGEDVEFVWDNLSRFRLVVLQAPEAYWRMLAGRIRSQGVLRIVRPLPVLDEAAEKNVVAAYGEWLRQWLGTGEHHISWSEEGADLGRLSLTADNRVEWLAATNGPATGRAEQTLNLAHGGDAHHTHLLRYRNHGVLRRLLPEINRQATSEPPVPDEPALRMAQLLEVLATRVAIFDNRVLGRVVGLGRRELYEQSLRLTIEGEEQVDNGQEAQWIAHWDTLKRKLLAQCHFLVLHLSFIEKILQVKYSQHPDYEQENAGLFIEQEILPHITIGGRPRENFILVITTGRGRTKWWSKIQTYERYHTFTRFTLFRPVESIISAVEDALARKDDLELKYNVVKLLFGS